MTEVVGPSRNPKIPADHNTGNSKPRRLTLPTGLTNGGDHRRREGLEAITIISDAMIFKSKFGQPNQRWSMTAHGFRRGRFCWLTACSHI
jgi:hypothetical protein